MKEIGIYVHIPFCVSKCKYCNFSSVVENDDVKETYLKALLSEIKMQSNLIAKKEYIVNTIYIGGGTPSILPMGYVPTILSTIKENYNFIENIEISMEVNPNSVTYSKALEWVSAGVNRISVGLQSSKNNLLKTIGRAHTKKDYISAMQILKSVGFTNINTDMMIALPKQKMSDVRHTISTISKSGATHISAYSLILEENTLLYQEVKNGILKLPKETKAVNMYTKTNQLLNELGYNRYEVSNYCLNGYECKHNLNCWSCLEYIGFGSNAHSYYMGKRLYNEENIEKYITKINKGTVATEVSEDISSAEKLEEIIMLGLRTMKGINLNSIKKEFGVNLQKSKSKEINLLTKSGFIEIKNEFLMATNSGFYVLNQIILKLID